MHVRKKEKLFKEHLKREQQDPLKAVFVYERTENDSVMGGTAFFFLCGRHLNFPTWANTVCSSMPMI